MSRHFFPYPRFALLLGFALSLFGLSAGAATLTVTNLNDNGAGSLRQAIADAASGDAINFDPTLSGQTITLTSGELAITKTLTIDGDLDNNGVPDITLSGNSTSRVFNISNATVILEGLIIQNGHVSNDDGGGIYASGGTLTITNSTLLGNSVLYGDGGGIFADTGTTLTITNSTLSGNSASFTSGYGGGVYASGGILTITNSTLSGNSANFGYGSGIYASGGTLTITNSTLSGNSTNNSGGGIYAIGFETLTITNSTLSGNNTNIVGGGIYASGGTLTITNSTLSGNSSGNGGGIIADGGILTITNSTLSGNRANFGGGGIVAYGLVTLTITNSTLSGNRAAEGGGIVAYGGTLTITNSTLSGNSADRSGGGIYNYNGFGNGDIGLKNTLLAANTPQNCAGAIRNDGNNLEDGTSCGWGSNNGSISGTDPLLGALGDYGGPTQTLPLLTGSPAIDAGSNAAAAGLDWDQRGPGYPRIVNGTVDIGAVEVGETSITTPSITALVPASGPTLGGTSVTITGTNFIVNPVPASAKPWALQANGTPTVTFGGTTATSVSVVSPTQITAVTPAHAAGAVDVVVTTSAGTGALPDGFLYNLAPQEELVLTATPTTINVKDTSTLSTTGGSGSGAVTYAVETGPCTISGNTLTGTGAGSCSVTATKAADSTYDKTTSQPVIVIVTADIPALSPWALSLLGLLLAGIAWRTQLGKTHPLRR